MSVVFDDRALAQLRDAAEEIGLMRLGVVNLDHPGFAPARTALARYLEEGLAGEMAFMERTGELRAHPDGMLPGAKSMLIAAVPHGGEAGPIARYAQFADYHTEVHRRLLSLDERLKELFPDAQTLVCVDTKPVLERSAATLAGLGFLGKNGCLIAPGLGSYLLLGGLLCDQPWQGSDLGPSRLPQMLAHEAAPWDACGSCVACLEACPTDAFDAPGRLDPRRCISYLTIEHRGEIEPELAQKIGVRVAGCDVCQEVCPHNHSRERAKRIPEQAWLPEAPGRKREPELARLATIGNNQHRGFVKQTALNRIPRRAFRRNALLALANLPRELAPEEREAVKRGLEDPDPQIQAAAQLASARFEDLG